MRKFGTKRISAMRGGLDLLPWSGPLFLLAIFALGAMPPFGLFRSEFEIVAGGLGAGDHVVAAILIIGVTVAFLGLALGTTRTLMQPARASVSPPAARRRQHRAGARRAAAPPASGARRLSVAPEAREPALSRGEPTAWMVVPVVAGALVLLVLGLHPPAELTELFGRAVRLLSGAAS